MGGADISSAFLGFVTVVAVGFDDGGFFSRTWDVGTVAFTAVVLLVLVLRWPPALGSFALVFVLVLALLTAWTLVSTAWGIPGTSSVEEARRTLLYVAAAGAFALVADRRAVPALLGGVFAGIVALGAYGLVDRAVSSRPPDRFQGTLLVEPIGYANALGILAAMGCLLGIGFVLHANGLRRLPAIGGAAVAALALFYTESRGAWFALACGLAVLVAGEARSLTRRARWLGVSAGAAALLVGALVVSLHSPSLGHRPAYWRAALDDAGENPVLGSGAGSFDEYWLVHRELEVEVRDAHSLYLESLAELGLVGLALVVLALSVPLLAATRARGGHLLSAALGAYVAFLVHAGVDWDWEVPVTTLSALACATALVRSSENSTSYDL
jgi:O-antigen ligase